MWRCAGKHKVRGGAFAGQHCLPAGTCYCPLLREMQCPAPLCHALTPALLVLAPQSPQVWYEWAVTQPLVSSIHNPSGRSHAVGL